MTGPFARLAALASVLVSRGAGRAARGHVALTFEVHDAGEDAVTDVVERLRRLGVRATFFVRGAWVSSHPEALRTLVRSGHEVAGNGFSGASFAELGRVPLVDELTRTSDLLPPSRTTRTLVRPCGRMTPAVVTRVAAAGYTTVSWSVDATAAGALVGLRARAGDIVRFDVRTATTELADAIERLRASGLEPCTVAEIVGA